MLTTVEARSSQGALLELSLETPVEGYIVEGIEGLDPVKATLVSSSFANADGERYSSSRREVRDIKLRLELVPDYVTTSVRQLRRRLYAFFMPKSEVHLSFILTDGPQVNISGRVESFEAVLFSAEPAVDISIRCFDPDFIDPEPVVVSGISVSSTGALTDSFVYEGSVETGIVLTFPIARDTPEFTFYHQAPSGRIYTLDFASPLLMNDTVTISTVPGDKYATLTRAGSDTSILRGVAPYSKWIEIEPGTNYIRLYTGVYGDPFTIEFVTRYGGL